MNAFFTDIMFQSDSFCMVKGTGQMLRSDTEICGKILVSQAEGMRKNRSLDIPKDFDADRFISQGCGKLVPIEEGHLFELRGQSLQVVSLPGHSKGNIGLLCPEERVLYTGDAINGSVYLFLEGFTPLSVYRETLKKAMGLDFDHMIISHGFSLYPKSALDNYLKIAENPDFEHMRRLLFQKVC